MPPTEEREGVDRAKTANYPPEGYTRIRRGKRTVRITAADLPLIALYSLNSKDQSNFGLS